MPTVIKIEQRTILISDKIDFRWKSLERTLCINKGSKEWENITNIYAANNRSSKYIKQNWSE